MNRVADTTLPRERAQLIVAAAAGRRDRRNDSAATRGDQLLQAIKFAAPNRFHIAITLRIVDPEVI